MATIVMIIVVGWALTTIGVLITLLTLLFSSRRHPQQRYR